jgi:hypothetical protein
MRIRANHRGSPALLGGCPPSEAVTTAIGIRDACRLARSCGVNVRNARNLVFNDRPARSVDSPCRLETPRKRCATTKAMIFSCRRPDRLASFENASRAPPRGASHPRDDQYLRDQAAEEMPEPDRDKMDFK